MLREDSGLLMVGIVYIDFEGRALHSYNLFTLIQSIDMSTTRDQVLSQAFPK